jgi:DNA-binding IclR family transcriptional regulator
VDVFGRLWTPTTYNQAHARCTANRMNTEGSASRSTRGTQSLERSVALLKHVAASGHGGMRLADLVELSGVERPTAHRMVKALVELQLLAQSPGSKRYVLGDYCRELAAAFADRSDLRAICEPVLKAISEETGNSAFLLVRAGLDSLCVARSIGSYSIQVLAVKIGNRQPLGVGAGGLAILATLPRGEQTSIIEANAPRLGRYGSLSAATLRAIVSATQRRGYAAIGHYSIPGVIGIGVALRNAKSEAVGAITTASVDSRMTRADQLNAVRCIERHVSGIQARVDAL